MRCEAMAAVPAPQRTAARRHLIHQSRLRTLFVDSAIAPASAIKTEHPPDGSLVATAFQLNSAHVEGGAYQRAIDFLRNALIRVE